MKTRLDELTAAEFIDLVCGDPKVLYHRYELVSEYKVTIAMRNIVMEYRSIADPGGNAAYLRHVDDYLKARLETALYSMCKVLSAMEKYEAVRQILTSAGHPAGKWDDRRLENETHIRLEKSKRALSDLEKEDAAEEGKENIRSSFDTLIASLMAHFKFQIDTATMMAPIFAHLVARHNAEIKAMHKALKK